jgi:hypothetical protein
VEKIEELTMPDKKKSPLPGSAEKKAATARRDVKPGDLRQDKDFRQ